MALERRSWKHGIVGLEKNPLHMEFYQSIIPVLAEKGRASIHFLVTGEGRQIAGIICCSFEQTVYVHHTVYDPDFSKYSPGKLLMGLVLKRHMDDHALTSADLLCGFADYYKPWAARIVSTTNISVFRLSPGMRISLAVQWFRQLF
ncbi:MAG: GNAT family N-acetyltransferase [Gammaproteobacteria bacterium]|nr:GNAT family N-acetyltransferase [Gammaproteobacteria bacterium]